MAKYIERETAIAKLTALEVTEPSATMIDAKRLLAEMPLADVAPVVRCRECKFAYRIDGPKEEYDCRKVSAFAKFFKADHFCSFSEKKDGGSDE
jgi:hypothetical protein